MSFSCLYFFLCLTKVKILTFCSVSPRSPQLCNICFGGSLFASQGNQWYLRTLINFTILHIPTAAAFSLEPRPEFKSEFIIFKRISIWLDFWCFFPFFIGIRKSLPRTFATDWHEWVVYNPQSDHSSDWKIWPCRKWFIPRHWAQFFWAVQAKIVYSTHQD